ncbi:MAG TPA: DNA repair protein RecN [Clostridiales bacterium]|nr:DNA repair protein RecN [Clostridiales bacterium]
MVKCIYNFGDNMITSLKINNIALIEESLIKFGSGFNVLTGETGAGKSIIIDSLSFVLGSKADKTLIKTGKDFARVEVVFDLPILNDGIVDFFSSINLEPENTIIISRYYNLAGKNEIRVNGEAVTLSMLKKLTINLVDIHGQHDHQALLDVKNHIKIIDSLNPKIDSIKEQLKIHIDKVKDINNQIADLGGEGEDKQHNIQLFQHEIHEIEMAELKEGEEEQLLSRRKYYANSEKISKNLNDAYGYLMGNEGGMVNQLKSASYSLGLISDIVPEIAQLKERVNSAMYELSDITDSINDLIAGTDYDEDEVNQLEERLDLIKDLKRKYGNNVRDIFEYLEKIKNKLDNLLNSEQALIKLNTLKKSELKQIFDLCQTLTNLRKEIGESIKNKLLSELKCLGIKNGQFEVVFNNDYSLENIEKCATYNGADNLEFMFSANAGIELRPLSKIISGGEMSRFMLAFKCVIQDNSGIKTLVFDEIDTGIGGMIGAEVGKKIVSISKYNQVICITHLAQIASFADNNYLIEKTTDNNYTTSSIKLLDEEQKVKEITRMLGLNAGENATNSARDLINDAINYKQSLK